MRYLRYLAGFLTALTLAAAFPSPAGAAEKEKITKYKGHVHEGDASKKKTFDLKKQEDREALAKHLENGELEDLEQDAGKVNPMDIAADLGIWALVVFVGLLWILRKHAWTPMLQGLQKREETIKAAVDEAKLARAETQRVTEEFKAKMAEAQAEIPKMMDEARRKAQQMAEE